LKIVGENPITQIKSIVAVLLILLSANTYAMDAKNIFRQSKNSVVLVMAFDKNSQPIIIGSGFFIDDGNKIATNFHIVKDAVTLVIKKPDGTTSKITETYGVDYKRDIILLSSPIKGKALLLETQTPEVGDDILAIGNPKGFENTLSIGIVSGIRSEDGTDYYQITSPISPGSSGGPIINKDGNVVGVSTFYMEGGQNLNFSVPSAYIFRLLKENKKDLLRNVIIRNAKKTKDDEMQKIIDTYRKKEQEQQVAESDNNKLNGKDFPADNKTKDGVVVLPSGLQYKIIKNGKGKKPVADSKVLVHYRGTLIDGTEFDNSYARGEPIWLGLNQVIKGWQEALQLMSVGSKWQIVIPSELAYGKRGAGRVIGPNATLIFDIELLSIK